jgi:hypothetical protein
MSLKRKMLLVLMFAMAAIAHPEAKADSSAAAPAGASSASSGGSSLLDEIQKNGIAAYLAWLTGPNTQALSGNKDGTGTNLSLSHYGWIGWKFNDKVNITLSEVAQQTIDDVPAHKANPFVYSDPYITLTNSKLMHSDYYGTNLMAYIRYYVPASRTDHDNNNAGRFTDLGYGGIRLFVNPTKSWFDGKLTFNGQALTNIRFASLSREERARRSLANDGSNPNGDREDFYVLLDPVLDYQWTPKVDVYLEYATGYLRHHTNGHFVTNPRSLGDGQWFSPGLNWTPTKKILLNPYLSWGPRPAGGVKNTDIGVQFQYTFL